MDWWALGVILFEFLAGIPPFSGETIETVFENINNLRLEEFMYLFMHRIAWPEDMAPEAKDLITKLLVIKPEKRLGYNGYIIDEFD